MSKFEKYLLEKRSNFSSKSLDILLQAEDDTSLPKDLRNVIWKAIEQTMSDDSEELKNFSIALSPKDIAVLTKYKDNKFAKILLAGFK